jgi:thiosulfate/3-mercaptopyruvate sulfurtransferase
MKRLRFAFAALLALGGWPLSAQPPRLSVSTEWLQAHARDRDVTVVEIGDRATFEKEHIAGARFLALGDIAVTRNGLPNELPEVQRLEKIVAAAGIPDRGRIVLYARDPIAAARGFFTLDTLGASDAVLLDGGFAKWSAEKRPVEQSAPPAKAATFVACPRPDAVLDIGAMRKLVDLARENPAVLAIVDARPAAQFDGAEPGPDVKRPGHIASAVSAPWNENLTGGVTPVFRDANELRELYRRAGVDDRAAVVVYCRTGMQAAVDYFVLRALERDVYLYDGSYIEWSAAEEMPVDRTLP